MKYIFSVVALLLVCNISAQELPAPRTVDREYRPEYREAKREAERTIREAEQDGFDIILDPIELVPVERGLSPEDFTNWGYQLIVADLRERIKQECTYTVVLDICDTSAETDHPDLSPITTPKRNYSSSPGLPDKQGHGTHCGGIAFGKWGGIASALWEKGLLLPKFTKVLSDQGSGSFAQVANMQAGEMAYYEEQLAAGRYVVQSWSFGGGTAKTESVERALIASNEAGVLTVAASGNNAGAVGYPGNSDYTFCIGSVGESLKRSNFSNYGPQLNLVAPGERIVAPYLNRGYASLSGTSMATPIVAGVAAIAYSKWGPKLPTPAHARAYLEAIATDLGEPNQDDEYGWGLTYVRAVLDNDPDDVLDDDPDEPGEPDPPINLNYMAADFSLPGAMQWRGYGETSFRTLQVTSIRIELVGDGDAELLWEKLDDWLPTYFGSRAIVLGPGMDTYDAVFWTGQFLEYIAEQDGLTVDVVELTATDGTGSVYYATGFDRSTTGSSGAMLISK